MNQRASHFQFGSSSQNFGSVYAKDYTPKEAQPNQVKITNPFRGGSLNHGEHGSFATTNKALLKPWDNAQRAKLNDDKLRELKTHHFKLGSYAPGEAMTTNKLYHDPKIISGEASKNQEESKHKMRTHNHDFKEQGHTNYRSAYADQFTSKERDAVSKVAPTQGQHAICFGKQVLPMVTTSGASYLPKAAEQTRVKPQPTLGIKLGDKGEPMQTMNQLYYTQKQIVKANLPESTMKELRATHFQLGQMPPQYQTQSHNYRSAPGKAQESKLTYNIPTYQSGTWVDKEAPFNPTTTNQRELPPREVKPFERVLQNTKNQLDFGKHTGSYTTEFKGKFGPPGSPVPNTVQVNKRSNVVIGGGGSNSFNTEHKSSYRPNNLKQGRVDLDIKKLSREDHFHIGGSGVQPKLTIYQDQYRPDIQNRSHAFHKDNN